MEQPCAIRIRLVNDFANKAQELNTATEYVATLAQVHIDGSTMALAREIFEQKHEESKRAHEALLAHLQEHGC